MENYRRNMTQREGYKYLQSIGEVDPYRDFYRLFRDVLRLSTLTHLEKIVFVIIQSFTDDNKQFFMSNKRLAVECAVDHSTISKCITSLKNKGYIEIYKRIKVSDNTEHGRVIMPVENVLDAAIESAYNEYRLVKCV